MVLKSKSVGQYDLDGNLCAVFGSITEASYFLVGTSAHAGTIMRTIKTEGICYGHRWKYTGEEVIQEFIPDYSDRELSMFVEFLKSHEGLIYWHIRQKPYIAECDIKDYFQECCIWLYKNYKHYVRSFKGPFGTWLSLAVTQCIISYNKKVFRYKLRTKLTEYPDDSSLFREIFKEYADDDNIERLMNAIRNLPDKDQEVIEIYLSTNDIKSTLLEMGYKPEMYFNRLKRVRERIYKNRERFFVGPILKEKDPSLRAISRIGNNSAKRTKILQFDISRTKFIRSYDSVSDAAKQLSLHRSNISKVLTGNAASYAGYYWKYATSDN